MEEASKADGNADDPKLSGQSKRGCAKGCLFIILFLVLTPPLVFWFVFPGVHHIAGMPEGQPYTETRFEFRFGHATRYVSDPGNHMQWVFGELPDSITVTDGIRLIVYDEPKAIIKSSGDSMDVQNDTLKHKGYMGIWDEQTHFVVDSEGVIRDP